MCPQRHSAKCLQAHKNSLRFKPQSSSLFAQAVPRARWNPDHSQNHNLVPWGCLSLSIQTWSLFQLNPTTGSSTLLSSLMISPCTCGQLTSERSLTHLKWSRTSRQWLESSMVPPSKDGKSIKGGEFINSNLMDTLKGLGITLNNPYLINTNKMEGLKEPFKLSWKKHSAYASQHACHNHGGNSAWTMQFT